MKTWILNALLGLTALAASADPLTLINTLPTRPLFTLEGQGHVITRSIAPGNRASLEAGLFSGLGQKELALQGGQTYYLALVGALPQVYQLAPHQALVLNQSGRAVELQFSPQGPSALLASGSFALGEKGQQGFEVSWVIAPGTTQTAELEGGRVYRLVLASPEGVGTAVVLTPWD